MFLAFAFTGFFTIAGALVAVIMFLGAVAYTKAYVKGSNIKAQLASKDSVIETNRQTIEALEDRLEGLNVSLKEMVDKTAEANSVTQELRLSLERQEGQYEVLKRYTAPEAMDTLLKRSQDMYASSSAKMDRILTLVQDTNRIVANSLDPQGASVHSGLKVIITGNKEGRITFFNRQAEDLFGYKENEVYGRPITMLMPERFRDAHLAGMERYLKTGEGQIIDNRPVAVFVLTKTGEEIPITLELSSDGDDVFTAILRRRG